jgi:hypothetical protein
MNRIRSLFQISWHAHGLTRNTRTARPGRAAGRDRAEPHGLSPSLRTLAALAALATMAGCNLSFGTGGLVAEGTPAASAPGTETPGNTTTAPASEHRIGVRQGSNGAEFYDRLTGEPFVPRGMNYNRFLRSEDGSLNDNVLSTTRYDPAAVDADFAAMHALGFNVVRIMLETCGFYPNGCITTASGRLNPEYFANLADFLERAKAHELFVMVASNTLPDDGYWINATAALQDEYFQSGANEYLNPLTMPIYADYWGAVVSAIIEAGAPLDAIWAYELRQEHLFDWNYAPFNLDEGLITTANGETYDLAEPGAKERIVDEGLVYWADSMRNTIRELDPTALVTVGFFVPNEPNPVRGDDPRLVRTAYFLRNATVDFVDLHHYRGNGVDDNQVWENFGLTGVDDMPIVLGEQGAIRDWYSSEDRAAAAVLGLEVEACRVGFDGFLVWAWRGDLSRDIWWASEGEGLIARVVSPTERPDPCAYGEFDFIRYNVAPRATISASSHVPELPPENVADEKPDYWNAAALSPQWVQLTLEAPTDVEAIVLTVAQDPPGRSVHEIWVQQSGGEFRLMHTFDGVTDEGDVLTYQPEEPLAGVEGVRVVTTSVLDLWPAWHEIEILTRIPPE